MERKKLVKCSSNKEVLVFTSYIFISNLRAPHNLLHRHFNCLPLSLPFYLCLSCAHIPVFNVRPFLALWSYASGRIESWPQPFSKGASNPAFLTRLLSVRGIRESLSPVIYHNDETQLWAVDSCQPPEGDTRGEREGETFKGAFTGVSYLSTWVSNYKCSTCAAFVCCISLFISVLFIQSFHITTTLQITLIQCTNLSTE